MNKPLKTPRRVKIMRIGEYSHYLRLPQEFMKANNLRAGDSLIPDFTNFKIIRAENFHQPDPEFTIEPVVVPAE
jgi:hypothetical protein